MKEKLRISIQEYIDEQLAKKAAGLKVKGNEPKMAYRALRSLLMSEDSVYGDLAEKALSEGWTGEQIKNKIRGITEKKIPDALKITETDRIHHRNPLEFGDVAARQKPEVLRDMLLIGDAEGEYFGDSDANVRGSSYDERAHTGARPKSSKGKFVAPNQYGVDGIRAKSAHPRGTNDKAIRLPDRVYGSGKEMYKAAKPSMDLSKESIQLGNAADKSRRLYINKELQTAGITKKGVDVFSRTSDPGSVAAAQKFFKDRNRAIGVAEAFDPNAGYIKAPGKVGKTGLVGGTLLGAGGVVREMLKGNYKQAGKEALKMGGSAIIGEGVQRLATNLLKKSPTLLKTTAPIARAAGPVGVAYSAINMLDSVVEGATGKNLQQTGQAASVRRNNVINSLGNQSMRRMARKGRLRRL